MSNSPPSEAVAQAPPATIDYDLKCHACGYNLRTLAMDHRCPECNEPVASSLAALDLARDPQWLGRIRAGLALVPAAGVATILSSLCQVILLRLVWTPHTSIWWLIFMALSLGPVLLEWWWEWLVTSPRDIGPGRTSLYRRILRVLVVVQIVLWVALTTLQELGLFTALEYGWWLDFFQWILWVWCLWRWLAIIAAPLRRPGLMKHLRILQWVTPIFPLVRLASDYGMDWYRQWMMIPFRTSSVELLVTWTLSLSLIVVSLWALVVLLRLRYRLAQVLLSPASYYRDLILAFVLLGRATRSAAQRIGKAVSYHGQPGHGQHSGD